MMSENRSHKEDSPPEPAAPPPGPFVRLSFEIDKANHHLNAVLTPHDEECLLDLKSLRSSIADEGFSGVDIDDPTLLDVLRQLRKAEPGVITLGKIEPGVDLIFSYHPETRAVYGELIPVEIGQALSVADIQQKIRRGGFENYGIKPHIISDISLKAQRKQEGKYHLGSKPIFTQFEFILDASSGQLIAELSACEDDCHTSRASIQDELDALGFDRFHIEPNALDKLFNSIRTNQHGQLVIGQKRDAAITIECDDDLMKAYITVEAPQGGRDLDQELLNIALRDANIHEECCNPIALKEVLANKTVEKIHFASGSEPVDGIDAIFTALVKETETTKPKESKTGKIDHRETVSFTIIDAGVPLMKRTPAKTGINGRNVKGQVIPAIEGDDSGFDENLEGAATSEDDSNLLVSTCKGHPVIQTRGVRVDNTIVVKDVDMSTGNINYDGSLMVTGEVRAGMKIKVTGDIVVLGVVTKADLKAKNNITIHCGVIGSDPTKDGAQSPPATLKAGGDIKAQYINQATLTAGHNIEVKEYISHCKTEAKHKVLAGQNGGKGRIFGGTCYGQSGVSACSLGATGDIKTLIAAGTPLQQQKQFEHLLESHDNRVTQAEQLNGMLKKYRSALKVTPKDVEKTKKAATIQKLLDDINQEINKMGSSIGKIKRLFKESRKAEIGVRKSLYSNVALTINGAEFHIRQESKGGLFTKEGADIRWRNFNS